MEPGMKILDRGSARRSQNLWQLLHASRDDRGSLALLMVVMLVGMGLALLMLPLVMTQTGTTSFDAGRGRELQAAESGLDIGVGMIRAGRGAVTSGDAGVLPPGDFGKLPCAPVSGTFDGSKMSYTASFAYYPDDPVGKDSGWLADNEISWSCPATSGGATDDPAVLEIAQTARYVQVTAVGKDAATGRSRTLTATYVLGILGMGPAHHSDPPPSDGSEWPPGTDQIRLADSNLCVTSLGKNVTPTLQPCDDGSILDQQRFMVTPDGYIQLISRSLCLKSLGNSQTLTTGTCTGNSWIRYPNFPDNTLLIGFNQPNGNQLCLAAASSTIGAAVQITTCTEAAAMQWWITILRPGGPGEDPGGGPGDGGGDPGDGSGDSTTGTPYIAVWPGMQNLGEN
jgi:hypothetical protein